MEPFLEETRAHGSGAKGRTTLLYSDASSQQATNGWGGARNAADRRSDYIKLGAALRLVEAARGAMDLGMPFNRHLTVHWAMSGVEDPQAAKATGALIKLMGDWIKKRGGQFAHAWAREIGRGKGTHVHILVHLPKGTRLDHMTRRWVRRIAGDVQRGAIKTRPIGGTTSAAFSGSDWYQANLAAVIAYVLKGVDEAAGEALGLDRFAAGGPIIGKRVSVSQNLMPAGRGRSNSSIPVVGQRAQSSVTTLTAFFSAAYLSRARARPEAENQNFADDFGKSGEAA